MVGTRQLISRSGLVRIVCALSLLLVAFAHQRCFSAGVTVRTDFVHFAFNPVFHHFHQAIGIVTFW